MFYPIESLKRGGRFYLCWVADSWPLRFATITHRQLWSQDIRIICDDLLEVMTNESGRPTNRFSLRLSSQLMRGLVRLYQRKVTVFLSDCCMINANVIKTTNKKWNVTDVTKGDPHRPPPQQLPLIPQVVLQEEPENEQRIEEMIKNSGNVVTNIQEITLRESIIPEFQLPPNDGFGEERPDQTLQLVMDRTLETMMRGEAGAEPEAEVSAARRSALDLTDQSGDRTRDRSRAPHDRQMERISEHDVTAFSRMTGEGLLPVADFEKEIPEIPEIPPPELHAPQPEKQITESVAPITEPVISVTVHEPSKPTEPVEFELEDLEEAAPQAKRRRVKNKLIIDKKIKLGGNFLRARIDNPAVELRCEDSSDDIVDIRVPWDVYFRRPCHAGSRIGSNLGLVVTKLFMRNLGVASAAPLAEREMEEIMQRSHRSRVRSILERIEEVEEPAQDRPQAQADLPLEVNVSKECLLDVTEPRVSVADKDVDISDLLTQKIETRSLARKRAAEHEVRSPKRQRSIGYISFRESQQLAEERTVQITEQDTEKENIPEIGQQIQQPSSHARRTVLQEITQEREPQMQQPAKDAGRTVTAMLQEAGLADIQPYVPTEVEQVHEAQKSRRRDSEGSETPLGSLDRTKVSLGDSDQTTDSKRFIRDQWGTEGTMVKILKCIKAHVDPLTVWDLIAKGPIIAKYKRIIVARCFTSILKLKQHGFIKVTKDPDTLEIWDIMLGPKFD